MALHIPTDWTSLSNEQQRAHLVAQSTDDPIVKLALRQRLTGNALNRGQIPALSKQPGR